MTNNFFCLFEDMYYGGEAFSAEQPQAFTCPFCGKMGFTETTLQEHVTAEHPDTSIEVVSFLGFEQFNRCFYFRVAMTRGIG